VSDEILIATREGVGSIHINRPAKKNALTSAMYAALAEAFASFDRDDRIRVATIAGGDDFTAGNDLGDFIAASLAGGDFRAFPVLRFLERLRDFTKPVVAAVRGNAVGIGTTMLLHCDAVVAGTSARFRLPFAQLGLVPEAGSSLLLPLTVGRARASALLLSGEALAAEQALAFGLVNLVKEDESAEIAAEGIASRIASLPPEAVRETKRLIRAPWADAVKKQMDEEAVAFAQRLASPEFREAARTLLAKA
jgi:enoyl-CoA hydratase/carnithine racemase